MGAALNAMFIPISSLPGLYELPSECVPPLFVPSAHLVPSFGGIMQLTLLFMTYAYFLYTGSKLISDGSELLYLIPEYAPLVGSVVLPILGAVPDGAIVLFSGLSGTTAQAQVSLKVGIGALAGSTVMLLTIPWTLAVYAGRVKIVQGKCDYRKPKLTGQESLLTHTGVEPKAAEMKRGWIWIAVTAIPYCIVQGSGFAYQKDPFGVAVAAEKNYVLVSFILTIVFFFAYLLWEVHESKNNVVIKEIVDQKRTAAMQSGTMSLEALFGGRDMTSLSPEQEKSFKKIVRTFFTKYDQDGNGNIDKFELKMLLQDLHVPCTNEKLKKYMTMMDKDKSGTIEFHEFLAAIKELALNNGDIDTSSGNFKNSAVENYGTLNKKQGGPSYQNMELSEIHDEKQSDKEEVDEDSEEEEEFPEDLADLPPKEQRKRLIWRSCWMMLLGTTIVVLFSDPMISVLSEIGYVTGIPPFFVAFILAPLASNASELISSYSYALRKTKSTITISLVELEGATIMNNTFCLAIFFALIYFRGLNWAFTSETLAILLCEAVMIVVASKKVQTVGLSIFVLSLFPLVIAFVAVLEYGFGFN